MTTSYCEPSPRASARDTADAIAINVLGLNTKAFLSLSEQVSLRLASTLIEQAIAEAERDAAAREREACGAALFTACHDRIEAAPPGPWSDGAQWAVGTGAAAIRARGGK